MNLPKSIKKKYHHMIADYVKSGEHHEILLESEYSNGNGGHQLLESTVVDMNRALSECGLREDLESYELEAYIDYAISKLDDLKDNDYEIGESFQQRFMLYVGDNTNLIGEFTFRIRELQPWEE